MATTTADAKRRVILAIAKPGDVFDVQMRGEGQVVLVRLERPNPTERRMSKDDCLQAIDRSPLRMELDWNSIRALTREP